MGDREQLSHLILKDEKETDIEEIEGNDREDF